MRSPEEIDAILPQTQCGLCGYGGCMPYAEALVFENAPINLCPPGGISVLKQLGELLQKDPMPYIADMQQTIKQRSVAFIREDECIGCVKCIKACPVDAILGSAKQMHTVLASECTGCELCIPACPVDCIDLLPLATQHPITKNEADQYRKRFHAREERLRKEKTEQKIQEQEKSILEKKKYIEAALMRYQKKKCNL